MRVKKQNLKYSFIPRFYRHCVINITNDSETNLPRIDSITLKNSDSDNTDMSNSEDEKLIKEMWKDAIKEMSKLIKKDHLLHYIVIENLTNNYQQPCVLDLKMGVIQYCIIYIIY